MKNTVKNMLLMHLSFNDYFRAKNNMKQQGNLESLNRELINPQNPISVSFAWHATKEGTNYWYKKSANNVKPNDNFLGRFFKWIIRFVPFLMILVILQGCQKEREVTPDKQYVTYTVNCPDCLLTFQDDKWNDLNDLDRSKQQYVDITGNFNYRFENTTLDSIKFSIYVSVFGAHQYVNCTVTTTDGRKADLSGWYGFSTTEQKNYPFSQTKILVLK